MTVQGIVLLVLFVAVLAVFGVIVRILLRLLKRGGPEGRFDRWGERVMSVLIYVGAQARVLAQPAGLGHFIIFWGFVFITLGTAEHILGMMCESGAAAISVEQVDMTKAIHTVPRQMVLVGNISPTLLAIESSEEIRIKTMALLEIVKGRKEFVVAPGCDLSSNTPLENIISFVETVKNYRPR